MGTIEFVPGESVMAEETQLLFVIHQIAVVEQVTQGILCTKKRVKRKSVVFGG